MLTHADLLAPLAARRTDQVVVTTMSVARPWGRYSQSDLDFASADSAMGHAADLALGIALARPDRKVICLNGDGSMLMSLGTLATIVEAKCDNLLLFVVENTTYEITGNQPIPGAGELDFEGLARAAGFPHVFGFDAPVPYEQALDGILAAPGPIFVRTRVAPGDEGPISRTSAEEADYLRISLAESARRVREALGPSVPSAGEDPRAGDPRRGEPGAGGPDGEGPGG